MRRDLRYAITARDRKTGDTMILAACQTQAATQTLLDGLEPQALASGFELKIVPVFGSITIGKA